MHAPARHGPAPPARADGFGRIARRLAFTWVSLLVLMGLSLGSSFIALGTGNFAVSFTIAVVKAALVVWIFMQLKRAPPATRIAAVAGLFFLAVLMTLSGFDYATRRATAAPWQVPQQVVPALGESRPRRRSVRRGAAGRTGLTRRAARPRRRCATARARRARS